jgi:hypothetical protein
MNFEQEAEQMWDSGRTDEEVTDYLDNLILELVNTYYAWAGDCTSPSEMHYYLVNECGVADWRATEVVAIEFDGGE